MIYALLAISVAALFASVVYTAIHGGPITRAVNEDPEAVDNGRAGATEKDYDNAALNAIYGTIKSIGEIDVICGAGQYQVDHDRATIARYRKWLETQTDPRLIRAYNKLLDFYDGRVNNVENAIKTGVREKWLEKRRQEDVQRRRQDERSNALNLPHP